MEHYPKTVMYVDDDPDDREFLSEAFKEVNPEVEVIVAQDGLAALEYLNTASNNNHSLPCLIVLDINMPYLDGSQTFKKIRNDHRFQHIPIVVFTSSESPHDKQWFSKVGIELIIKPDNLSYFSKIANYMLSQCA